MLLVRVNIKICVLRGEQIRRRLFGVARLAGNVCNSTVAETSWKKLGFQRNEVVKKKKKHSLKSRLKKKKKRSRFDHPILKFSEYIHRFLIETYDTLIHISFYKEFNDLELENLGTKFSYGSVVKTLLMC